MSKLIARCKDTKAVVEPGAEVVDFRGDKATFLSATRANEEGRDGKVYVDARGFRREYYAGVYGLEIVPS